MSDLGGAAGVFWAPTQPDIFASAVILNTGAFIDYRWHPIAQLSALCEEAIDLFVERARTLEHRQVTGVFEEHGPGCRGDDSKRLEVGAWDDVVVSGTEREDRALDFLEIPIRVRSPDGACGR